MAEDVKRTLFRHPLAAVGGALFVAGVFFFVVLVLWDVTAGEENPYRALVTFVVAPAVIGLGLALFLVSVWLQFREARRKGEKVKFRLSIEPTDPRYLKNLWLFLGLSAGLLVVVGYSGTRAYEVTDSVAFCGQTCHTVMEPQNVTYHRSPHARVKCVDCHIGPGASFWVKSKIDGLRQVWATALDTYSRPIETPVENLRPAQETCEECHWPAQFYGTKMISRTYYRTDEENSPWTINLLMKIGGGNPRVRAQGGIHWHMLEENKVEYVAADRKRQIIAWVRKTTPDGETKIYRNQDLSDPLGPDDPNVEIRTFDCMDCHNRPSHIFLPPAVAINRALNARNISPDLPNVRKFGLELLNEMYDSKEQAHEAIEAGLHAYYDTDYPELASTMAKEIAAATNTLLEIYDNNFLPEMNTDYRARENNLSHFVNDGCFRCHNPAMVDDGGDHPVSECSTCHLIAAQGPSESIDNLEMNLAGLEFQHPEDIAEMWREMKCTGCHTPESGY